MGVFPNSEDGRVVKAAGLRSAGCISSWVRPPLLAQFFLCNDIFIKKMFPELYNII